MDITIDFRYYPGFGDKPRPALRITARAHRRGPGGALEEFAHTRVVDAKYPDTWAVGLARGIRQLQHLHAERDALWFGYGDEALEERAFRLVG